MPVAQGKQTSAGAVLQGLQHRWVGFAAAPMQATLGLRQGGALSYIWECSMPKCTWLPYNSGKGTYSSSDLVLG